MVLQCAYCGEFHKEPASDKENYDKALPTHVCEVTGNPTVYLPVPRNGFRKHGERKEQKEHKPKKKTAGMMMNYGRSRSREVGKDR